MGSTKIKSGYDSGVEVIEMEQVVLQVVFFALPVIFLLKERRRFEETYLHRVHFPAAEEATVNNTIKVFTNSLDCLFCGKVFPNPKTITGIGQFLAGVLVHFKVGDATLGIVGPQVDTITIALWGSASIANTNHKFRRDVKDGRRRCRGMRYI